MFRFLARQTYRRRGILIAAGLLVLVVGILYGTHVFAGLKDGGFDDPASASAREARQIAANFPRSRNSMILLAGSASMTVDQAPFQADFQRLIAVIEQDPSRPSVDSYYTTKASTLVSKDRHATFALIGVSGDQDAVYLRIRDRLPRTSLSVHMGGPAVADCEINEEVQKDLPKLGAVSLPILAILLVLIFRSLIAAALPLLIGAISVLGAFSVTRLISSHTDISVFAANIISLLGLGLAIDYSLLFVSRFRDELASGKDAEAAIAATVCTAGESVFLSGSTVALSLLGLLVFPEMFLRSMGLGGAIAVVVAMAASLTVLPALLSVLGSRVNLLRVGWPKPHTASPEGSRVWRALGEFVVRYPIAVLVVTLGIVLAAGDPFLHAKFANPGIESLPRSFQARYVADAITRDFPSSQNPPVEILLVMRKSPVGPQELPALTDYTQALRKIPSVTGVDGLTSYGDPLPPLISYALYGGGLNSAATELEARYLAGDTTLIMVNYTGASGDPATQALLRAIRARPAPAHSEVLVGGATAELTDRLDSLRQHLPEALAVIFVATFVVLLLMLSSIVIPLKAIVLNTLSLAAAFGLMTWIFQEGHLNKLLHFTPSGSLDPTLPVLIFAIAFGLATDYEVFLVSRIREEYQRTGSNAEAVVIGVEKTGGIITSAGLLLVVVVAAFGMSDILSMKEMGVGLAIAVSVDAAIVRTLLVPAAMQLFGRLNWWLPGHRPQ